MNHARRWKLSSAQRADMWSRWKAGQSLNAIGRALGKDKQVIHFLLARHGGIAPATRRRSRRALTLAEREDISRGIASGCSMRGIARRLSRACSTVSREVVRHGCGFFTNSQLAINCVLAARRILKPPYWMGWRECSKSWRLPPRWFEVLRRTCATSFLLSRYQTIIPRRRHLTHEAGRRRTGQLHLHVES